MSDYPGTGSLTITRTELGLTPLELQSPATGFRLVGPVSFGARLMDRKFAPTIPWLDYERMTHARLTNGQYAFSVAVIGETPQAMHGLEQLLFDAFGQFQFVLTHRVNGITRSYTCYSADLTPGDNGETDETWHDVGIQVWKASGPHRGQSLS